MRRTAFFILIVWLVVPVMLSGSRSAYGQMIRRLPPVEVIEPGSVYASPYRGRYGNPHRDPNTAVYPPPVVPPTGPAPTYEPSPHRLAAAPGSIAEAFKDSAGADVSPLAKPPQGAEVPDDVRDGFFQKLILTQTYLPKTSARNAFGIYEYELRAFFALPCPTVHSPLLLTPGFSTYELAGPEGVDLPPRIYEAYNEFTWMSQVHPRLGVELAVVPGLFSDLDRDDDLGFRLRAHAAAAWTWTESTKIVFGAAYLDRPDIDVIPIAGVIWEPNPDVEFEAIFPHPKLAHRIYWFGQYGHEVQDWIYFAVEFGGDSWKVSQADGSRDEILLRDYRFKLGVERKVIGGLDARLELGYVTGREIRFYNSPRPDFDAGDTVVVELKLLY